ncbi:elongation factor 1-gamma-like [Uranotaenia lowii]|uniref:elongation factor 1-gamma-like n=1 Tax=Uranotaenia lowii TaxID=190385 RepID=UPI00247B0468|nr:elongation factor 1-gamma-like [Uranotaenia lowii]
MAGTLYTYLDNFRVYKALIAALLPSSLVSPNFVFGETNKSADFLKKFPFGKVPAFETADGKVLTESNAIAYYVWNEQLRFCRSCRSRTMSCCQRCMPGISRSSE